MEHDSLHSCSLLAHRTESVFMSDFGNNVSFDVARGTLPALRARPRGAEAAEGARRGCRRGRRRPRGRGAGAARRTLPAPFARRFSTSAARSLVAVRPNACRDATGKPTSAAVGGLELDALVLPKATPEAVTALGPDGPGDRDRRDGARRRQAYETAAPAASRRSSSVPSTWAPSSASSRARTARGALRALAARPRLGGAGIRPVRHRAPGHRDDEGLEAECASRPLARLPRQGLHPPRPGRDREPRLLPHEGGAGARPRVIEAYEHALADGRGARRARRRDDRPPRRRAGAASPGRDRKEPVE